jgi:hypothetical protein
MTTSISGNMIRIAQKHGWVQEGPDVGSRVTLVRRVDTQCIRLWVDFHDNGTIRRALAVKIGGPEQTLPPVMGQVLAFVKENGS